MTLTITPAKLQGAVTPPPSKSQAHRFLIAAALAEGESLIRGLIESEDISATRRCLAELGAEFQDSPDGLIVRGTGASARSSLRRLALPRMDCGESGSTLRFLIPVALAVRGGGVFTGRGRLMRRPQGPYAALFRERGIFWEQEGDTLTVQGNLTPGEYRLPGNVSSQFFTGLLYALPFLDGPSAILPTTPLESEGYLALTLDALDRFGIKVPMTLSLPPQYCLPGNQQFQPADVAVEADWSQAAFWYAASEMGNNVTVEGMNRRSLQHDRRIIDWINCIKQNHFTDMSDRSNAVKENYFLDQFFQNVALKGESEEKKRKIPLESGTCKVLKPDMYSVKLDVSQNPDIVPPAAALGAVTKGTLCLDNAARLRLKESDRLAAIREELNKLGARVTEERDRLLIRGVETLRGGRVDAHNDHRIAMMLAIAATRASGPVTLSGAESVKKSYPSFWEDYVRLGGKIRLVEP